MRHSWTQDDHTLVAKLTAEGMTIKDISEATGLPAGSIKHSRIKNASNVTPPSLDKDVLKALVAYTLPQLRSSIKATDNELSEATDFNRKTVLARLIKQQELFNILESYK